MLCGPCSPENAAGGSKHADLGMYEDIRSTSFVPVILAGGITPDNIEDVALKISPYMADIMTGVESSAGIKDENKLCKVLKFRSCV